MPTGCHEGSLLVGIEEVYSLRCFPDQFSLNGHTYGRILRTGGKCNDPVLVFQGSSSHYVRYGKHLFLPISVLFIIFKSYSKRLRSGKRLMDAADLIQVIPVRCQEPEVPAFFICFFIRKFLKSGKHAAIAHVVAINDRVVVI